MITIQVTNTASPALEQYSKDMMRVVASGLEEIRDLIAIKATSEYMREFTPAEVVNPASSRPDGSLVSRISSRNPTTKLRRITGRLTASILGKQGGLQPAFLAGGGFRASETVQDENIHEMTITDTEARLTFGSRTPYAARHEYSRFSYLRPAIREIEPRSPAIIDQRLQDLATELGL